MKAFMSRDDMIKSILIVISSILLSDAINRIKVIVLRRYQIRDSIIIEACIVLMVLYLVLKFTKL